jgi:hypothetical protein
MVLGRAAPRKKHQADSIQASAPRIRDTTTCVVAMPNEHPKKGLTVISDAGRIGRATTGCIASAPTDTNPATCAEHRSRSTARTSDQSRLHKRRQAIVALMWSGPALFTFFITMNVIQALQHGYGLHSGRPRPEAVDTSHGGNGFGGTPSLLGS